MSNQPAIYPALASLGQVQLLRRAEQHGDVEVAKAWSGGYRASITVGKRYAAQLRVWGQGEGIAEALADVLRRVEPMLQRLGRDLCS